MTRQVVIIHGGDTHATYEDFLEFLRTFPLEVDRYRNGKRGWKQNLGKLLGPEYSVILPKMPNEFNCRYIEWKIWFEKFLPYLEDNLILTGHSMGGLFLATYLSQNEFPKKIAATLLVAAPYDEETCNESLGDFLFSGTLEKLQSQAGEIHLFHSTDDPVVPFRSFERYRETLPEAKLHIFEDRGHFVGEEFPELAETIRHLV